VKTNLFIVAALLVCACPAQVKSRSIEDQPYEFVLALSTRCTVCHQRAGEHISAAIGAIPSTGTCVNDSATKKWLSLIQMRDPVHIELDRPIFSVPVVEAISFGCWVKN
jgi:hypothetical protein